ncbi:MAG: 7-cyano-7-deazaguanine synthase QueC [Candidatus Delongbacteria bacterium]|nr:7-cyano-7-deazaguanine synthase QueC [Candidatus Delongbacteria bacterium]
MVSDKKKAVVLLSGGLDSTTCLAIAVSQGYSVHALSFDYGQKHKIELEFAKENAGRSGAVEHKIAKLDKDFFSASALTDISRSVQKDSLDNQKIPDTYVPARNTIFLSYALAYAETVGAETIFIGANSVDYSGYPDCRPEYISAFETMANLALKGCVEGKISLKIDAPLIAMTKSEIIRLGKRLGVDYSKTVSCYDPVEGKACGHCDSCLLRKKGFEGSGFEDETVYV